MSDSELSDAPPNVASPNDNNKDDATIESTLRRIVRDAIKKDEEITVRIARTRAEEELELEEGFFKEGEWKERSKNIINAAVEEPESPVKQKEKPNSKTAGRKRKSEEPVEKPKKRARKSPVVESEDEDENGIDEEEEVKPKPKFRAKPQTKKTAKRSPVVESDDEEDEAKPKRKTKSKTSTPVVESDEEDEGEEDTKNQASDNDATKPNGDSQEKEPNQTSAPAEADDDSDLSSLIDDPPPKKKAGRPKKSTSPSAATNTKTKPNTQRKPSSAAPTADEEEIKRLQSQLLKCGIRKLWHRELAHCGTSKAKITHLKSMLTDAGMTGRFSAEKARAIKEARELEAELESARDVVGRQARRGGRRSRCSGVGGRCMLRMCSVVKEGRV